MEIIRKVYIKSAADLPKEKGQYFIFWEYDKCEDTIFFDPNDDSDKEIWVEGIEWYLLIEQIQESDIEAWAERLFLHQTDDISKSKIACFVMAAKAALNGEIPHKDK